MYILQSISTIQSSSLEYFPHIIVEVTVIKDKEKAFIEYKIFGI